jgi:hypothetical protein
MIADVNSASCSAKNPFTATLKVAKLLNKLTQTRQYSNYNYREKETLTCSFTFFLIHSYHTGEILSNICFYDTEGPNSSQSIPATKLDGKVIIPVNVATVPSAVALCDG